VPTTEIVIGDEMIRLGQLLKLGGLVGSAVGVAVLASEVMGLLRDRGLAGRCRTTWLRASVYTTSKKFWARMGG